MVDNPLSEVIAQGRSKRMREDEVHEAHEVDEHKETLSIPSRKRKDFNTDHADKSDDVGLHLQEELETRKRKKIALENPEAPRKRKREETNDDDVDWKFKRVREEDPMEVKFNDYNFWKVSLPPLDESDMDY
jgi:hypothetical protein